MITVESKLIQKQINKCYLEWDSDYPANYSQPELMSGFKYYLERTAGIRMEFEPDIKNGRTGYSMKRIEIVDDKKYLMWTIKYS